VDGMKIIGGTAVVTGAGRGIGLAIATALARDGCQVAMVARSEAELAEAVTALVNNAGTPGPAGLDWEVDPDEWWECVESAVRGAFNCVRAFVPGMIERGTGRVIDIVSVTGTTAWPTVSATSAAKTALIRHAENLAAAGFDRGLRVFALHPGMVRTQLLLSYRSDPGLREFLDTAPDEAFTPPEVAGAAVVRIVAGDLDACTGRFLDATADLNEVSQAEALAGDALRLRLISSS